MPSKINLFTIILFFCVSYSFAQDIDSIRFYELEEAYISTRKGDINYTTLNFFSKRNKLFKVRGVYPIGVYGDSTNNFGIKIKTETNSNNLIIQEAVFLIHQSDTTNIKYAQFYVLIRDSLNNIKKIDLNHKELSFVEHPFYNPKHTNMNLNTVYLTKVKFNTTAITFAKNDALYFMKEDTLPFVNFYTSMMFVTSKKEKSYFYKNGIMQIVDIHKSIPETFPNQNAVWQIRLKFYEYFKEE